MTAAKPKRRSYGPVERAVRAELGKVPGREALKANAYALARLMDSEPSAAVGRELRLAVEALTQPPAAAPGKPVPQQVGAGLAEVVGRIGKATA